MSTVTGEEILAIVETDLTDDALAGVIDREEAYLAAQIGPLEGERMVVLWPRGRGALRLPRPTDAVAVIGPEDETIDVRLIASGWAIERPEAGYWPAPVRAMFTPNDIEVVRGAIIELVALTLTNGGLVVSEREGVHSIQRFQRPGALAELRDDVLRRLRNPLGISSLRLRSTLDPRDTPANGEPMPLVTS